MKHYRDVERPAKVERVHTCTTCDICHKKLKLGSYEFEKYSLDRVSRMTKKGAPIAEIVKECGYTEMREDGTERLKFTDFYESFLKEKGISIPSRSGKKAITMYAESVSDAHLTVQRLTEEGAEVISVCSIPDAEVLKFAIFAKFDPSFVNEAALWNPHNNDD